MLLTCVLRLFTGPADAEEPTPLAGEEFHTEVLGEPVTVPPRDRKTVTAASAGIAYLPDGPSFYQVLPFGAFYVWRHSDDYKERFRGSFSVAVNDVAYNVGSHSSNGWELRFTFNNMIIPLGRAEYVEGQIIRDVEVEWNYAFAGVGLAYRKWLAPGQQDNALEVSLTYEPGYRWFQRSKGTARGFIVPTDTYEGRLHARLRTDALVRNVMELPHRGYAFGGDFLYGHRATWGRWGGVAPFESPNVEQERDYLMGSVYAVAAGGLPFLNTERHRFVASVYGGLGRHLDRFSTFRLPGRPTGYEWEAISLPILPSVAFNELFPTRYALAHLEYRYQAMFFLYPYARASWGLVEQLRFQPNGGIRRQMDEMPALSGGVVSGAPWKSLIELNYSYNFGIYSDRGGGPPQPGRHGFFVFWSKEFR
ncbi:hypothetical protein [Nitrospira moscoviensis]|uniref:Putative Outer membrane channel n=1 Tax=Nitrospira moscoviensis TaxID=42253 RepID=A0A0K2GAN7_NITMO|nr:hypothetical protein [Nitrospira moscoviensis]ALA57919.1 putative Outer membrane channel [Nitrospira moscoviensis]